MSAIAREFVDFWVKNSVHAAEQYGQVGGEQGVAALTQRCIDMAKSQGISEAEMVAEVGDLAAYIKRKLADANQIEQDRQKRQ